MAKKRCPSCGKRVAPSAPYCLYCSHRFEDRRMIGKQLPDIDDDNITAEIPQTIDGETVVELCDVVSEEKSVTEQNAEPLSAATENVLPVVNTAQETVCDVSPSVAFDDVPEIRDFDDTETHTKNPCRRFRFVVYAVIVFVSVAAALVYLLAFRNDADMPSQTPATTSTNTIPTASDVGEKQEDFSWVKQYAGIQWVDEASVGKKDVSSQGGFQLYIHEVTSEYVVFDVCAYADGNAALAKGVRAKPLGDGMDFSFEDDGFGHSGTGNVHFRDGAIDVDVIVNDNEPLPENVHSLAMNTVMVPQVLPRAMGKDISKFVHVADAEEYFEQIKEPKKEETTVTYYFDGMTMVCDQIGNAQMINVSFSEDNRTSFCYEHIDGTMGYDVVKRYFGKAAQDYKESPTNIHVLTYRFEKQSVSFVFDAETMLLSEIKTEHPI